jgi:predicted metal-dependent hydrolase
LAIATDLKTAPYKLELSTTEVPVMFVKNIKARRYIIRLQDGVARVTIPRGGTLQYAEQFARKNSGWIERQLHRVPPVWADGSMIMFRGESMPLNVVIGKESIYVTFSDQSLEIGSNDDLRCAVESRMRTLATKELVARTWDLAQKHGMEMLAVSVRNQRSRWGSCSIRKRIALNWRLIQTSDLVRDYIIIHELMHLKEMNHSERFWKHVENAFPQYRVAERWLRKNSRLLR